jgi:hypothetical protein
MADQTVDVAVFRDSDSVVNFRELAAVDQWLAAKNIPLHSMNDHIGHPWPLMAGMFGVNLNTRTLPGQDGMAESSTRDTMATMLIDMFHHASMGINYFKEADQTLLFAVVARQFERSEQFSCEFLRVLETIDYRYADGRFTMWPRGVAVSNHIYLSSSKTRVNAGIRRWKLSLPEST